MGKTKIIFVGNYKGGVGKTTSVLNFAEHFSKSGKSVLALDLDPQSSLSEILVSNNGENLRNIDLKKTLNYVYDLTITRIKKYSSLDLQFGLDIVQHYEKGNYDFIASSLFYREELGLDELAIRMEDNIEYLSILKNFLVSVLKDGAYDFVLIDCPPSNNLITKSAFLLSDYYIIPTILDGISANGVAHYVKTVNKTYDKYCKRSEDSFLAKHYFGDRPELIGIFCTFIRGQVGYSEEVDKLKDVVRQAFAEEADKQEVHFFEEEINNYIDIARSTATGIASKARSDYKVLSQSVLKRIEEMEKSKFYR